MSSSTSGDLSRVWTAIQAEENEEVASGNRCHFRNGVGHECWVSQEDHHLEVKRGLALHPEVEVGVGELSVEHLNRLFLQSRRFCYLCGTRDLIGVALCIKPSDISEEERALQSQRDRERQQQLQSAAEDSPQKKKESYNPYPVCPPCSASVQESGNGTCVSPSRLVPEVVPVYVCVHCRRVGESGTGSEPNGVHPCFPGLAVRVPSPRQRNIVNKYTQAQVCIMRYKDEEGKIFPITDRLLVITDRRTMDAQRENLLFQQLELIMEHNAFHTLQLLKQQNSDGFHTKLARLTCQVIPCLLRAAVKVSTKISHHQETDSSILRTMDEFEKSFEFSLVIIRAALHLLSYPEVTRKVQLAVYRWNYNPFGATARECFQHWMDVIWMSSLVGIPFSLIRHSVISRLFRDLLNNYPAPLPLGSPAQEDRKGYLRRLFNEGRSRNAARQMLYTWAFAGMVSQRIQNLGVSGFIDLMDRHECYLPEDDLKQVWSEMHCVNTQIDSLEPHLDETTGLRVPGLFQHLGMGNPLSDTDTSIQEILQFLRMVRDNASRLASQNEITPAILEAIARAGQLQVSSIQTQSSSVSRQESLLQQEQERRTLLRTQHEGSPPISSYPQSYPRLTDCRCAYPKCNRLFQSARQLKFHLAEAWDLDSDSPEFSQGEIHRRAFHQGSCFDSSSPFHPWEDIPLLEDVDLLNGHLELYCQRQGGGPITCPLGENCTFSIREFPTVGALRDHLAHSGVRPYFSSSWVPSSLPDEGACLNENPTSSVTSPVHDSRVADVGMCVVCLDSPCSQVLIPCGHFCLCDECHTPWTSPARQVARPCPLCRTVVKGVLPIASYSDRVFSV